MQHFIFACAITFLFSCTQNSEKEKTSSVKDSIPAQQDSSGQKQNTSVSTATISITPLNNEGDQGQVTFVQNGKTLFYYNHKTKKGQVNLNGSEYTLDKFSVDSKTNSYILSGSNVKIEAPNFKYVDDEGGGDCFYGNAPFATIIMGSAVLKLDKIEVQDCPNY